ncbi:GGDEF domain-containing protein [Chitinimonas sp. PSY-7]|uniref:diguanylate cyclase domain-containing protein n=1 Tax=Chitinimonas sp. PSY-7 TaxID=3459088 RepID=UPI0040400D5D
MKQSGTEYLYQRRAWVLAQTFFIEDNQQQLTLLAHKYDFDMQFFDQMIEFQQAVIVASEEDLLVVDLDCLYSLQTADNNRTLFLRDLFKQLPSHRDYVYLQTEKQSGRFLLQQMLVESNCLAYAEKPIANDKLVDKFFNLFAQARRNMAGKILVVGAPGVIDKEALQERRIQVIEHDELQSLQREVKRIQPDIVVIAEHLYRRTELIVRILKRNLEADPSLEVLLLVDSNDDELSRQAVMEGFDSLLQRRASDILTRQLINRLGKIRLSRDLISRDRATGLLNKIGFQQAASEVIKQAEAQGKQLGLAVIDIDKFKTINDTWGHYFGDIVIKRLSLHLSGYMGPEDLLSRFGGEEFVMLLWDCNMAEMLKRIDRMREEFNALVFEAEPGLDKQFSFSGGAAGYPAFKTENELFLHADAQLYKAKQGGRNRIVG